MEQFPTKPNPAIDTAEDLSAQACSFGLDTIVRGQFDALAFRSAIHGGEVCDVDMQTLHPLISGLAYSNGVTDGGLCRGPVVDFVEQELGPVYVRDERIMPVHLFAHLWGGDAKPLTVLSGLIHLLLLCVLMLVPAHGTGGDEAHTPGGVAVRLVEPFDVTPVEESPGSKDSPASLPALAKRSPILENKPHQLQDVHNRDLIEQSPLGLKEIPAGDRDSESEKQQRYESIKKPEDPVPLRELDKTDVRLASTTAGHKDSLVIDSPVNYDSAYSIPSSSSPERRTNSTGAAAGNEYRNKIISAISDAAYYPKKALTEKIHGEAVVSFTVNKSGALLSVNICKPSGYDILDNAAMTIIKRASQKFPSIPDEVMCESLSYEVPIIFKKRS